jgi:hypothetical protein
MQLHVVFGSPKYLSALRQLSIIAFALILAAALATPAKADLVQNGGFEGTPLNSPGGYFCQLGPTCTSNVPDWMSSCNSSTCGTSSTILSLLYPGTNGSAFNGGLGLASAIADSPDGGDYIAGDGDPVYAAPLFQTINGLTVGVQYTLTFDQAAAQMAQRSGDTTEWWKVTFGSDTQTSTVMNTPSHSFSAWNKQTMTFTATATSEVLQFLAEGTPAEAPPVVLLDGVSLVGPPTPPVTTPEPGAVFLTITIIGLVGLAAIRRQRRGRA